MTKDILSEYSEYKFTLIGLDLTNDQVLSLLNTQNADRLKQIFMTIDDCENFLRRQNQSEPIVLIVSSYILNDQLIKLQRYSQIDSIYSYTKSDDINGEFICIYKRSIEDKYKEIIFGFIKHLWFIIGLIVVLIFAYLVPSLGASTGPLYTKYSVKWGFVFIIFLLNSLSFSIKDLAYDLFNYRLHITTQIYSLIFIPWVVFGISLLLTYSSMNKYFIIGLILTGSMPTGVLVNVISTKHADGNERGTWLNIFLGSILGVFISPISISLFMKISNLITTEESFGIHYYIQIIGILTLITLLPMVIGQIIYHYWMEKIMSIRTRFHFSAIVDVLTIILIWTVLCDLFRSDLSNTWSALDCFAVIMLNGLFILFFTSLGFSIARLPDVLICRKQRGINNDQQPLLQNTQANSLTLIERWRFNRANTITFMFCSSTKTVTSSILLIASTFSESSYGAIALMTLPVILYHIEQWILCLIEVIFLKRFF